MCKTILLEGKRIETVNELLESLPYVEPVISDDYRTLHFDGCFCQLDLEQTFDNYGIDFQDNGIDVDITIKKEYPIEIGFIGTSPKTQYLSTYKSLKWIVFQYRNTEYFLKYKQPVGKDNYVWLFGHIKTNTEKTDSVVSIRPTHWVSEKTIQVLINQIKSNF